MWATGLRSRLLSRCGGIGSLRYSHSAASGDGPSETLRKRLADLAKSRRKKDPRKDMLCVEVPRSLKWLDTPTVPMYLLCVATGLFFKILLMIDRANDQERIERIMKEDPPGTGTIRMLTREEWDMQREIRPRTPFESKYSRAGARIRSGDPVRLDDLKDWSIDMLTDGLTRAEDTAKYDPTRDPLLLAPNDLRPLVEKGGQRAAV